VTAPPAPDAETLSCAITGRYAGRWAQSVARPREEDAPESSASWYVDGFAGADLQRAALRGTTAQAVAIAAVQALDAATRIVLIDEDPGLISRLRQELDRIGLGERVHVAADPAATEPGQIALVEAPFASVATRLASAIGDDPALVRLAPLTARTLPWAALEPIAELAGTDVLLRVPLEDFAKQAHFTGPLADLPPNLRRLVEGCSALLADPRHGWVAAWRTAQRAGGADAALAAVLERMQALLAGVDEDRSTRALPVAGKAGSVHLLLSTPHAAHLSELELALDTAVADSAPAPKRRAGRKSAVPETPAPTESPAAKTPASKPAVAEPPITEQLAPETAAANPAAAEPAVAEPPVAEPPTPETVVAEPAAAESQVADAKLASAEPPIAESEAPAAEPAASEPPASEPAAAESTAGPPAADPLASEAAASEPAAAKPKPRAPKRAAAPAASAVEAPPQATPDEPAAVLDLFALSSEPEPARRGPDPGVLADQLHARHVGTRVPVPELLSAGGDGDVAPEQVRAALAVLKRTGRAAYGFLEADAEVEFLEPRVSAPRPRKTRTPSPDLLGLFDEPEE
jgi:three-Cys-motif partner protein